MKPLSIVIITYNRPDDVLLLLKNIVAQEEAKRLIESVIIIDNNSNQDYNDVQQFITLQDFPFQYIHSTENLGVARGRNKGIELAKAPIIITIDDDAYFKNNDALVKIEQFFQSNFAKKNNVGVFCFKVLYSSTGELQANAFPHKKTEKYRDKHEFLSYFYAGGANAILKKIYDQAGEYPTDFFYGMEEYDLSYRILDLGYRIAYNSSVAIIHNESPKGRTPHAEKMQMLWINKSKVAYRYLPNIYFISTAIMWSLQFLFKTNLNFKFYLEGWRKIFHIPKTEQRKTINKETLDYIKSVEGRLWY
ncbi:MAG: glycosyltransferase [Chitinophagaceae bacterium]